MTSRANWRVPYYGLSDSKVKPGKNHVVITIHKPDDPVVYKLDMASVEASHRIGKTTGTDVKEQTIPIINISAASLPQTWPLVKEYEFEADSGTPDVTLTVSMIPGHPT